MLIDSLTYALEKSGALEAFWGKLDAGEDAALGVAASARPFMVAARFIRKPQPTLAVVAGEEAAANFARNVSAYLGDGRVAHFPERSDLPFKAKAPNPRQVARRLEVAHALASGREMVVVASARALLRMLPPVRGLAERHPVVRPRRHRGDEYNKHYELLHFVPYSSRHNLPSPKSKSLEQGPFNLFFFDHSLLPQCQENCESAYSA